jgi:hypothetical protein
MDTLRMGITGVSARSRYSRYLKKPTRKRITPTTTMAIGMMGEI